MVIQLLQDFILLLIAFTLMFGLGFIINMLLKTTWFPIIVYLATIIGLIVWSWGANYGFADIITILSGLAGAVISGSTIRMLRLKGYKMF